MNNIKFNLSQFYYIFRQWRIQNLRCCIRMIPCLPKLIRNKLWIPKDKFHPSLELDINMMTEMSQTEQDRYLHNLILCRQSAHNRNMK